MIANYYTLFHIAADLHRALTGRRLSSAFSQHRNELVLAFDGPRSIAVIVSCEPSLNALYARDGFQRARKNSIDLFPDLTGQEVAGVQIAHDDREVSVAFTSGSRLLIQMYGSRANVLLYSASRQAGNSVAVPFLKRPPPRALPASVPPPAHHDNSKPFGERFVRAAQSEPALRGLLKRLFPAFGAPLIHELLLRSGFDADRPPSSLSNRDLDALASASDALQRELMSPPSPRIYYDRVQPVEFSIIPLEQFRHLRFEQFESIHSAVQAFIGAIRVHKNIHDEKTALGHLLERERKHTDHTIQKIEAETAAPERADEYERCGKLLIANLGEITKGTTEVTLEDIFQSPPKTVTIALDRHLTPARNAERLFDRARKARSAREEQAAHLHALHQRRDRLNSLLSEWDEIHTPDTLREFLDRNSVELTKFGIVRSRDGRVTKREPLPFRVFVVDGGFQVWAGKSGENNDLLTTRHTAKNDIWFHTRGVGGSHVVLKVNTGKGEVSRRALQQAAAIAAYYSKMKNASHVPVTMCEGKYVRKPKGAPAGTVVVERETTVFADPGLPPEQTS